MAPRCSVIVPVYNRADAILETLESVWDQTYVDFEVILVDDGSTDNLTATLAEVTDPRLHVLRQENSGPAAARNRGVAAAQGSLIAYLDSDDLWFPNHLQYCISEMDRLDAPVVYSPMVVDRGVGRYVTRPGRPMREGETFAEYRFVAAELLLISTVVHRRELCERVQWDERLFYGNVDQFMLDVAAEVGTIPMLDRPTAKYNDITGPAKLSQANPNFRDDPKFLNYLTWLDEREPMLSEQAVAAHKARNLARVEPRKRDTLRHLSNAYRSGAITSSEMARSFIRARQPQLYRYLIDSYVYLRGEPLESLAPVNTSDSVASGYCEVCGPQHN